MHQLPEDILDVTKIESKTLDLKKERFNLNDVILYALDDKVLTTQFINLRTETMPSMR